MHISRSGGGDVQVPRTDPHHGKIFIKRGEWVHDKSKDAEKIEAVFASLAAQ